MTDRTSCLAVCLMSTEVYVDDIDNLREADFFNDLIEAELVARNAPDRANIQRNPSYVAKVVATRYVPFEGTYTRLSIYTFQVA